MTFARIIERKPKTDPKSRCCWICGRLGGDGMTTMLLLLGYNVPKGDVAHAHPACVRTVQRKQQRQKAG